MEMCIEDEDSLEEQNFKCPYCNPQLISQDNVIKHMENKHSMVIILYNFILSYITINYMCSHVCKLLIKNKNITFYGIFVYYQHF